MVSTNYYIAARQSV